MKLIPYLHFNGECEQALNTYADIFGGTGNVLSRFGDNNAFQIPDELKNKVMHAQLAFDDNTIFMSDSPGRVVNHGDGTAMSIGLSDEAQARKIFEQLSAGGEVIMPFEKQFWGATFGQLTDKFGIRWMINCQ